MKIKALRRFQDYKENVVREVGDEFEVTKARFEEIKKGLAKFGEGNWVEEVKEDTKPQPRTKKTTQGEAQLLSLLLWESDYGRVIK